MKTNVGLGNSAEMVTQVRQVRQPLTAPKEFLPDLGRQVRQEVRQRFQAGRRTNPKGRWSPFGALWVGKGLSR